MKTASAEAYFEAKAEIKDILREIDGGNLKLEEEACKIFDNDPEGLFRELIFQLVNVRIPREQARDVWAKLTEHRTWMSQRLGRHVTLRQTAFDYFTVVDPRIEDARIMPREVYRQILTVSEKDAVTGLSNRLAFNKRFAQEVERAVRYNSRFTLVIVDVDNFKSFNDDYGHTVGDRVLKLVASIVSSMIRKTDQAFRLGGDEFVLILPEIMSQDAWYLIDRIRRQIVRVGFEKKVTISCGMATFRDDTADPQKLFTMADSALYVAKDRGRNCVATYNEGPEKPSLLCRLKRRLLGAT